MERDIIEQGMAEIMKSVEVRTAPDVQSEVMGELRGVLEGEMNLWIGKVFRAEDMQACILRLCCILQYAELELATHVQEVMAEAVQQHRQQEQQEQEQLQQQQPPMQSPQPHSSTSAPQTQPSTTQRASHPMHRALYISKLNTNFLLSAVL